MDTCPEAGTHPRAAKEKVKTQLVRPEIHDMQAKTGDPTPHSNYGPNHSSSVRPVQKQTKALVDT